MLAVERRLTSPLTVTLLLLLFSPPIPAAQAGSYSEISEALGGYAEFLLEEIPEVESLGNNPCAFVHGVLYVCFIGPGASCYPLVEANGLSLESFSFMITHVNEVALADDPDALAKARRLARSLSDCLLNKSSDRIGGLWASSQGRFIDVERSYYVLSGLIEAVRAGVLSPTDPGLLMSLNSLMGVQNGDGGWGYYPGMTELGPVYSESNVYVTSLALDILLRAYDAGVKPTGIERSIEKGIEFLQGAITVDGDEAYWQGAFHPAVGSIDAPVLSGYAGRALAMASFLGFDVSALHLEKVANYLSRVLTTGGPHWIQASPSLEALMLLSSLGLYDFSEFKPIASRYVDQMLANRNQFGAWGGGAIPDILAASLPIVRFLVKWLRVAPISITLSVTGTGMVQTANATKGEKWVVESSEITCALTVTNEGSYERIFSIQAEIPPDLEVVSEEGTSMSLQPGQSSTYELKLRAPAEVANPVTLMLRFLIVDELSGEALFSRRVYIRVLRNAELVLVAKQVNPPKAGLGDLITVTVSFKNSGDVSVPGCTVREILGEGFTLMAESQNYSMVAMASQSGYPMMEPIRPGQTVTYTYVVKVGDAPPGPALLSKTILEYVDALGNSKDLSREVNVSITRPLVLLSVNQTKLELEWGQTRAVKVVLRNDGNAPSAQVSLRVRGPRDVDLNISTEGSVSKVSPSEYFVDLGELPPGETAIVTVGVSARQFYFSPSIRGDISIEMKYSDQDGQTYPPLSDRTSVGIVVGMSSLAKVGLGSLIGIVILLVVVRLRRGRREERPYPRRAYGRRPRRGSWPPRRTSRRMGGW